MPDDPRPSAPIPPAERGGDDGEPPVFQTLQRVVDGLAAALDAHVVFLVDGNGMLVAAAGDSDALARVSFDGLADPSARAAAVRALLAGDDAVIAMRDDAARLLVRLAGGRAVLAAIVAGGAIDDTARARARDAAAGAAAAIEDELRGLSGSELPFRVITDEDLEYLFGE